MDLLDEQRLRFQTSLREVKEEAPVNTEESTPSKKTADKSSP